MKMDKLKKITELKEILKNYEEKLAREMIGYRGVVHESAASEIKHSKVMVYKDMVESLKLEIHNLEKDLNQ